MSNYPGSLHNHTEYSNIRLRDSINKIDDMIDYALQLGHECIAFTDHECISSFVKIEEAYEKVKGKIKIIRGNEIYLTRNGLNGQNFSKDRGDGYYHFILLAKDIEGYKQICKLSTAAWLRSYSAQDMIRVPTYYADLKEVVAPNNGHLIATTACIGGQFPKFLLKYRETNDADYLDTAKRWAQYMVNIFGEGNFYLEMQPSHNEDQIYVNKMIVELSEELNIPYIISTDSHYLRKSYAKVHESFLKAKEGEREVASFYATTYMMGTKELESYFEYFPHDVLEKAYNNIRAIYGKCEDFSILRPLRIPYLPWYYRLIEDKDYEYYCNYIPSLRKFNESEFSADKQLVKNVIYGIKHHSDLQNEKAYAAIEECLDMTWVSSEVNKAQWSAYYLNLQRIIDECWNAGSIVGPARGSGGGFVLLYCLDIIQVNALRETTKCFPWRFLNPERVSVLDIDFDISGIKRAQVLAHLRKVYGEDRVTNVATFRTEKSRSAIQTAARGLGISNDDANYIASLVEAERGTNYTLSQMYYGDEKNGIKPNRAFVEEMDANPDLWEVASSIEGIICGLGIHAGGIVFNDEPFTETASLMKAPDGTVISGYELHDLEKVSLIKYDALSVVGMDRIQTCLELLIEYGYVEPEATLKETYEKIIGVYNIEREDPKMWEMVWNHEIVSLFQMEQQSGVQGIATLKPTSVDDLAILNSTIRLMAAEKGGETPTEKLARFKADPECWIREMRAYGLGEKEQEILRPILGMSYGLCIAQEQFMELVQLPELGGFSLTWADKLRKSIAKKNPKEYDKLTEEFYKVTSEKGINQKFAHYVWDVLIAMSKGYGFNQSHTLGYSLVALQEMNLAYKYPTIFWNTANLIVDSDGNEKSDDEDEEEEYCASEVAEETVDIYEVEDWEEYDYIDSPDRKTKKKVKNKVINFGKIASVIGRFKNNGIVITPPDINRSSYTFTPNVENNTIVYGLRGITRVPSDLVKEIIDNRPYCSIKNFIDKVKAQKLQIINLIKSGAFDLLEDKPREEILKEYIESISEKKSTVNLRNMQMLIKFNLIPEDLISCKRIFLFNKFLKEYKQENYYYLPDEASVNFVINNYDADEIIDGEKVSVKKWDNFYKLAMEPMRAYLKKNCSEVLRALNYKLFMEQYEKYASGSISKWEMESVSFYSHDHELKKIKLKTDNFFNLPSQPVIEKTFRTRDGGIGKIYKLNMIAGTVIDKNKNKNLVTLLTPDGVVSVKIYANQFSEYDKRISQRDENGEKKVIEKSWFTRGNLLIVQGIRRDENFIPKKKKDSYYPIITKINHVREDGALELQFERPEVAV